MIRAGAEMSTAAATASQISANDPARQSFSQNFIQNMDQSIMKKKGQPLLPDLATSKLSAVSYQKQGGQPMEEIISGSAATA